MDFKEHNNFFFQNRSLLLYINKKKLSENSELKNKK